MMATLKIKNLKQVQTALRKKITKQLRSPEIRKGVAEIIVSDIKDSNLGTPAEFTKDMRQYLEQFNTTDPKYRRDKISANFTGELLQDLINNVKAKFGGGKSSFILEHSNKGHTPYKQGKGKAKFSKKKTFKETRFDKKTGSFKQVNKTLKVPYSFISTMIIKKHKYDYLKFSSATESKVIKFIRDKVFKNLK